MPELTRLMVLVTTGASPAFRSMTSSQLQQFLARVNQEPELERRLEADNADPEAIAASAGFTISARDYAQSKAGWQDWTLSRSFDEDF